MKITIASLAAMVAIAGGSAIAQTLNLNDPTDGLKASRKMQCSLTDGEAVTMWFEGNAYSRVPGERDRLLFKISGMNIRQCTTVPIDAKMGYGYRMTSKEIMLYLDTASGQPLRTWQNPWTGKTVEVMHVGNDPVNQAPTYARRADGTPARFAGGIRNGQVQMSAEIPLFYTNPLAGDYQDYVGGTYQAIELFNFFTSEADLMSNRPGVDQLGIGWTRVAKWLPWMEMGDRAGQMIISAAGGRLKSFDGLSEVMKKEIADNYPGYNAPPPHTDTRPNDTTWTVFKRKVDQKKK